MELDARCKRQPPILTALERCGRRGLLRATSATALNPAADLIQRLTRFLQRLDFEQTAEVFGTVMVSAADTERRRNQALLDVETNRAPRYAAKLGQLPNRVPRVIRHAVCYMTVTVTLSTVAL